MTVLTRRLFLAALPLALGACKTTGGQTVVIADGKKTFTPQRFPLPPASVRELYAEVKDGSITVPAPDLTLIDPDYLRREVRYSTDEAPGTVIIDTPSRYLYLIEGDGKAMRYGIGVGREGFAWSGDALIQRKAKWPSWHPPVEMQARDPKARKWASGMPGGLQNPLGARAHYLYQNGHDTLYRIHGTSEPWTIGTNVSSGCIRMVNQDVIDLFERIPSGTRVVVIERKDATS